MPDDPPLRGRGWALYALAWAIIGLVAGSQTLFTYQITTGEAAAWPVYAISLSYWCSWGLAGAVAVRAAARLPLGRGTWVRRVPVHLGIAAVLAFAVLLMHRAIRAWLGFSVGPELSVAYINTLDTSVITYGSIVLGVQILAYQRAVRRRDRRAAELAARLSEARLSALRSQLHPHFLFNTLNGIQAFIRDSPETAEEMVAGLADLLRMALEETPGQQVALDHELEFVDRYLELQRLRLGDRLEVRRRIEGEARAALVPVLVLQPLVENAIEHGIADRRSGGRVEIEASIDDDALVLTVGDDGPGPRATSRRTDGQGVALRNIRERLQRLYGDRAGFALDEAAGGGTEARVVVPYIVAPETIETVETSAPEEVTA
ncbi:MAG: sensor histidine kinase [Gemmatimonadota bacterium]